MKPEALIILTPGFPENEDDTACIPPQQIFVKALKEIEPELNIIVLTFQYPFFSAEYDWHGVKVISFGHKNQGHAFRLFTNLRVKRRLKKLNHEYRLIGLLSFWFGKCAFVGSNFAKKNSLQHFSWILGQDAKPGNKYFSKIHTDSNHLIALSDFIAKEFNRNYNILPAHIIPVGIDTRLFKDRDERRAIDILGAGSLIELKRYDLFLEIIQQLKKFIPDIKAGICGDGPEMKRLYMMARSMKLENNISFYGTLPHQEVLELMQRTKIFLHPSEYEGFGAVCLEALYAGAHVISFVRPMDLPIKNWHIAADKEDMLFMLKAKLWTNNLEHQSILPYTIQANARALLKLFNATKQQLPEFAEQ